MAKRKPKQMPLKKPIQNQKTDWPSLLLEIWIGLFAAFYLLFPGTAGYRDISSAKTYTFFALTALLLGLGLWCLIRDLRCRSLRPLSVSQIAALAFLALTLISAAVSPLGSKAWYNASAHEAALSVSLYVLLFLIVARWGRPTERLFGVLFWSMAIFCVLCVLQAAGENPLGLYPKGLNYYDGYEIKYSGGYAGTIGNVDFVSAFLAMVTPMLALHTVGQRPRDAWRCWLLAGACLGVAVWIHVLCGLVGLALGGVICLAVLCPDRLRKWIMLGIGVLAFAGIAILWFFDLPLGFLHELHEILHGRLQDSFGTGRFYIWRQMLERIPERLFFGVGPDAARFSDLTPFRRLIPKAVKLSLEEQSVSYWMVLPKIKLAQITDAHCYPLHILYCQGLPALLSWLTLVGATLRSWYKARANRAVRLLGGGLVCFLCAMLFCPSSIIIMPFAWLTMGLIEAEATRDRRQGTGDR